jgi:hypothetical protein
MRKKKTCTQGDHPQAELAKFGYRSKRKPFFLKKKEFCYIFETW